MKKALLALLLCFVGCANATAMESGDSKRRSAGSSTSCQSSNSHTSDNPTSTDLTNESAKQSMLVKHKVPNKFLFDLLEPRSKLDLACSCRSAREYFLLYARLQKKLDLRGIRSNIDVGKLFSLLAADGQLNIEEINLRRTRLTNSDLKTISETCPRLMRLKYRPPSGRQDDITPEGAKFLLALPRLFIWTQPGFCEFSMKGPVFGRKLMEIIHSPEYKNNPHYFFLHGMNERTKDFVKTREYFTSSSKLGNPWAKALLDVMALPKSGLLDGKGLDSLMASFTDSLESGIPFAVVPLCLRYRDLRDQASLNVLNGLNGEELEKYEDLLYSHCEKAVAFRLYEFWPIPTASKEWITASFVDQIREGKGKARNMTGDQRTQQIRSVIKRGVAFGDPYSMWAMSNETSQGQGSHTVLDQRQRYELLIKAAKAGYVRAQVQLGQSYLSEAEAHPDQKAELHSTAYDWFVEAAQQGNDAEATCYLGDLHRSGIPDQITRSPAEMNSRLDKAFIFYDTASRGGSARGSFKKAGMIADRLGGASDYSEDRAKTESLTQYIHAADLGSLDAMRVLGNRFTKEAEQNTNSVPASERADSKSGSSQSNFERAYSWYKKLTLASQDYQDHLSFVDWIDTYKDKIPNLSRQQASSEINDLLSRAAKLGSGHAGFRLMRMEDNTSSSAGNSTADSTMSVPGLDD